jgi:hypothetical protein
MNNIKQISARIVAVFLATALSVLGAGSIVGVSIWQSALMAGIGGVATVVERLSRAYLDDGKLTEDEINAAFAGKEMDITEQKPAAKKKI